MQRRLTLVILAFVLGFAAAQPFVWPEGYNPSATGGGNIEELHFGDITTLNPYLTGSASESAILGLFAGPDILYRDWLGNRSYRREDGSFNTFWASEVEEVVPEQEYIITLREGWLWSDGTEMTADDAIAARIIHGDPEVESNIFACSVVDGEEVVYEKLGTYQYSIRLPKAQVNALASQTCGSVPAHIFMPVYEARGAAGVKALWSAATNPAELVSGGPFRVAEFSAGERIILERNPVYGEFVQAADGTPVPGVDRWVVTLTQDQNQELAQVVTGRASFYWPITLDQVRAISEAVAGGSIGGQFYPNLSPSTSTDFISYNFNNTDDCKRTLFRAPEFRQAISIMIDRNALVDAALGGLGFPAIADTTQAIAPFVPTFGEFEYDPEGGLELLASIGFSEETADGILLNPETGCRVEFDLQFNSGNNRRGQQALVLAQQLDPWGVRVNPREVSTQIWQDSITGTEMPRTVNYDAQIWGLAGGDIDNPDGINVFRLGVNLNSWNKDAENVEAWEIEMDRLTVLMGETLDLDARVAIFQERADLMRQYLPLTPLIAQSFHYYTNVGNQWPVETLDAVSIQSPYRPGNFRENLISVR